MTKQQDELQELLIKGTITNTSNKLTEGFTQETPTKTAYLEVDEETAKKMEEFGLTKYTSKKTKNDFFIIKLVDRLRQYFPDGETKLRQDLSHVALVNENGELLETPNWETEVIGINIISGEKMKNKFFRIQAILTQDDEDIKELLPENPFEDFEL